MSTEFFDSILPLAVSLFVIDPFGKYSPFKLVCDEGGSLRSASNEIVFVTV